MDPVAGVDCDEWVAPFILTVWARGASEALETTDAGDVALVASDGGCSETEASSFGGASQISDLGLLGVSGSTVAAFDDGASW